MLRQSRIETRAALLNEREVKPRGVGNGLQVIRDVAEAIQDEVLIAHGNGRVLPLRKVRNGLLKGAAPVRLLRRAAIASPPTAVHRQLLQIGAPPMLRNTRHTA